MCRNGRDFVAAVFATGLVGADIVLVNTEFRSDALGGALSSHQVTTVFCDNEFAERIRDAHESVRIIDPATVQTQHGEPRPKVAPSGPARAADLGHHRRTQGRAARAPIEFG